MLGVVEVILGVTQGVEVVMLVGLIVVLAMVVLVSLTRVGWTM